MEDAGKRNEEWMHLGSKIWGFMGYILACKEETKVENGGESGVIQLARCQNKGEIKAKRKRKRGLEEERKTQSHGLNCRLKKSRSN